jgi:predicted ABC-type ATPase
MLDFQKARNLIGNSRYDDVIRMELSSIPSLAPGEKTESIFVCGRYGAGKSTFADFRQGDPQFFPTYYHMDTDRIMKYLHDHGLTQSKSDVKACEEYMKVMLEYLSILNIPFTYSFAGNQKVETMQYRVSKNSEGYSFMSDQEKIIPKPVGHMVLCDTNEAVRRVRHRQDGGGHPYRPLEGDFLKKYERKQAEIIYGIPSYASGTDDYYIWDSSTPCEMRLVAHIRKLDQGRVVTIYDQEAADKFGLTPENMSSLFTLHDNFNDVYRSLLGPICDPTFFEYTDQPDEDIAFFDANSHRLSAEVMDMVFAGRESKIKALEIARANPVAIEIISSGKALRLNPFEKYKSSDEAYESVEPRPFPYGDWNCK